MSFFGNLFKRKAKESPQKTLLPRPFRIDSVLLEKLEFAHITAEGPVVLPILNISSTGIALSIENHKIDNKKFDGQLKIDQQIFPMKISIVRETDNTIGCRFVKPPLNFETVFFNFFKNPLMASSFSKIDSSHMNPSEDGDAHWYFDRSGNEVYFISKNSTVVHFYILIEGFYVEGGEGRRLKTGETGLDKTKDIGHKASALLQIDSVANQQTIEKGIVLLTNLRFFCDGDFDSLLLLLKQSL